MRGYRCHPDVDHLDSLPWGFFRQQDLKNSPKPERWFRVAHGCGFPEHKNPEGVRCFGSRKQRRLWRPRERRWKIPAGKLLVFDENVLPVQFCAQEEMRRIAVI